MDRAASRGPFRGEGSGGQITHPGMRRHLSILIMSISLNHPLSHLDPFLTVRRRNGTPNFHPLSSRCPTPHRSRCPPSLVASRVTLKSSSMRRPRRPRSPRKKRGPTLSTRRPVPRRFNPFLELLPALPVPPVLPSHRSHCQPNVCPPSTCSNAPKSSCELSRRTS